MVLGARAPSTAVIEFATSSASVHEIGRRCTEIIVKDEQDALRSHKAGLQNGPVFVGPMEMGLLRYQPNARVATGADHYVVVLSVDNDMVEMHDPYGHPCATLPVKEFLTAWKTGSLGYGKSYTTRTDFRQVKELSEVEVIRRSIPSALKHISTTNGGDMPPGSTANEAATKWLVNQIQVGLPTKMRSSLVYFAVQVETRRSIDPATCLRRVGYTDTAAVMGEIARTIGLSTVSLDPQS